MYPSLYKPGRTASLSRLALYMGLFAGIAGGASVLQRAGAIAAIVGSVVALVLLLGSLGRWYIRRTRRRAAAKLMHEGNELRVRMVVLHESHAQEFETLKTDLDLWWKRVEREIGSHRPDLVPILRSESGRPRDEYIPHGREYSSWANWLIQRITQLEKVLGQL